MRAAAWRPWTGVLLAFVGAQSVRATPLRLTMEEAVTRAATANADLNATRKDVDTAKATLERSKALLPGNPVLTAGAQRTTQTGLGPNYVFLLSQEFEIAGQRGKRIRAATEGVEKANWDVSTAQLNLASSVKKAFVQALMDTRRVRVIQRMVDAAREITIETTGDDTRALSDDARMDLNSAQIQESRSRSDLAAMRQSLDTALNTLRRLLGLSPEQEIELAGKPHTRIRELPALAELLDRAVRQRPDLVALRHATQRATDQLALAQRETIPNVTLTGTVSRFEGDTLVGGDISVPLPLFNPKTADVHEAIAERDRASLLAQSLEDTIRQEVTDARRACAETGASVQLFQQEILPRSVENLHLQRARRERRAASVSDLIATQVDLLTARRDYIDALQAYNEALVDLERVLGGGI